MITKANGLKSLYNIYLAMILLCIMPMVPEANAAIIQVTGPADGMFNTATDPNDGFCSIREALEAASRNIVINECNAGDQHPQTDEIILPAGITIVFTDDDHDDLYIGENDIIRSADPNNRAIIDARGLNRIFETDVGGAQIRDIILKNAHVMGDEKGAFIRSWNSIDIDNVDFIGKDESLGALNFEFNAPDGGAIYVGNGLRTRFDISISHSLFRNISSNNGSIIAAISPVDFTMAHVGFEKNKSKGKSLIQFSGSGNIIITDSAFDDNQSDNSLLTSSLDEGDSFDLESSVISNNNCTEGLISLLGKGANLVVSDSRFFNNGRNDATGTAWAIKMPESYSAKIFRSSFTHNIFKETGIYIAVGDILGPSVCNISNTTFSHNQNPEFSMPTNLAHIMLDHVTIYSESYDSSIQNRINDFRGLYNLGIGKLSVKNSILAYDTKSGLDGLANFCNQDTITSKGYNIVAGPGAILGCAASFLAAGDKIIPKLSDLNMDFELPEAISEFQAHPLHESSPAIDAGTCYDVEGNAVTVDARGYPRGYVFSEHGLLVASKCDMGAYEYLAENVADQLSGRDISELLDSDDDGVPDVNDVFPENPRESADTDGDGRGNNADDDDDGDGVLDVDDNCPWVSSPNIADTDDDGHGDVCDDDDDNDGIGDVQDNCPWQANVGQENADDDMRGDVCDTDDDNDGILDVDDEFPFDADESVDTDGDGIGNGGDDDDDGDGRPDSRDAFPLDPAEQGDSDRDGIGDNADTDDDGDGVLDVDDNCPLSVNANQADHDSDGQGNACDFNWEDIDNDGVQDDQDNCHKDSNANQLDTDGDGLGDACDPEPDFADPDSDGDGVTDSHDAFPNQWRESADTDGDGLGDNADDDDGNGVGDNADDDDGDGVGDNADDDDGDGVDDAKDNCPSDANAGQEDTDNDGIGDACDIVPNIAASSGGCQMMATSTNNAFAMLLFVMGIIGFRRLFAHNKL